MNRIFVNSDRRLRNGWWLLIFLGFVAVTRFAYRPVTHGLKALGVAPGWLEPAPFVFIMIATWACLRLRRETLADVGFQLDRCWLASALARQARYADVERCEFAKRGGPDLTLRCA